MSGVGEQAAPRKWLSPQVVLFITFAAFYFAIGPGNYFAVDEIMEEETAQALRTHADGRVWFHTGDVARMDDDGYTTIVQRKKDMIIVDGFNVYPSEVERVIYSHPAVRLAAVIGIPDTYHGEMVRACVVLKDGAAAAPADLLAHCRSDLAPYKVPAAIDIRTDLPTSAVGKILYRVLRDEAR
jgi:long-chain acyl-CoA synthetase